MSEKGTEYSVPLPGRAYGGDYCRTSSFYLPESPDFITWQEAMEGPLGGGWLIKEICQRPNTVKPGNGHDTIVEVKLKKSGLTFFEAIVALATFEISEDQMGFVVQAAPDSEVYFRNFAENEGTIIFDIYGKPQPTLNGRIVMDGIFPPDVHSKAMEKFKAGPPKDDRPLLDTRLWRQFNAAASFNDIDALLDQHVVQLQWKEFTGALKVLLEQFKEVQRKEFSTERKTQRYYSGFFEEHRYKDLKGTAPVEIYEKALKKAKETASALKKAKIEESGQPLLNEEQQQQIDRFFIEVALAYEIAQAKRLYAVVSQANSVEISRARGKAFRKHVKNAEKICRNLGETDEDIQRLNAELVNGETIERDSSGAIYYFPKAFSAFVDRCEDVIRKYGEAMESKRTHMRRKRGASATQSRPMKT